jgi:hypothetical protein
MLAYRHGSRGTIWAGAGVGDGLRLGIGNQSGGGLDLYPKNADVLTLL